MNEDPGFEWDVSFSDLCHYFQENLEEHCSAGIKKLLTSKQRLLFEDG